MPTPNTSVDQIFATLQHLAGAGGPVGAADLARSLGLSVSTAHRLLVTLNDSGYAERDTTGAKYELGPRSFQLVHGLFRQFGIHAAALPHLRRLTELTGETALLDVRVGWFAVRAAGVEGWREVHPGTMIGLVRPLTRSAAGRALLDRMSPDDRARHDRWAAPEDGGSAGGVRHIRPVDGGPPLILEAEAEGDHGVLTHVVRSDERPLAAVSLQGAGPLLVADVEAAALAGVAEILAELDALVDGRPDLVRDPFAHLDPDTILAPTPFAPPAPP